MVLAPWRTFGRALRMTVPAIDAVHTRLHLRARCAVAGSVAGSARRLASNLVVLPALVVLWALSDRR